MSQHTELILLRERLSALRSKAEQDTTVSLTTQPLAPIVSSRDALKQKLAELEQAENPLTAWSAFLQSQWAVVRHPNDDIVNLYERAVEHISGSKFKRSEGFAMLQIEHARLVALSNNKIEDARDIYKFMKSNACGQTLSIFFTSWANLEREHGDARKADEYMRKASACTKPLSAEATVREEHFQQFLRGEYTEAQQPSSQSIDQHQAAASDNHDRVDHTQSLHEQLAASLAGLATAPIQKDASPTVPAVAVCTQADKPERPVIVSTQGSANDNKTSERTSIARASVSAARIAVSEATDLSGDTDEEEDPEIARIQAFLENKEPAKNASEARKDKADLTQTKRINSFGGLWSANVAPASLARPPPQSRTGLQLLSTGRLKLRTKIDEKPIMKLLISASELEQTIDARPPRSGLDPNRKVTISASEPEQREFADPTEQTMPTTTQTEDSLGRLSRPASAARVTGTSSASSANTSWAESSLDSTCSSTSDMVPATPTSPATFAEPRPRASFKASLKTEYSRPDVLATADFTTPSQNLLNVFATPVQAPSMPAPIQRDVPSSRPPATRALQLPATPAAAHPLVQSAQLAESDNVVVQGACYMKLERIGKGGSSNVFKVLGPDRRIYALKEVDLSNADQATITGYMNEVTLLQSLQGKPNIIKLIAFDQDASKNQLYIVMECGDIDLQTMLKNRRTEHQVIDENHIRLLWQQMLEAVHTIHEARIVHADLKPANFLFVSGTLKLIDFGIATGIQDDHTSVVRENQIGTLNYMSPEAIQSNSGPLEVNQHSQQTLKVRAASDVWSLGCILYSMVYGRTPFQHLTPLQKLQAIVNPAYKIEFPHVANSALVDVLRRCLQRDPRERPSIEDLCEHAFLHPERAVVVPPTPAATKTPGTLTHADVIAMLQQMSQSGALLPGSPGQLARHIMEKSQATTQTPVVQRYPGAENEGELFKRKAAVDDGGAKRARPAGLKDLSNSTPVAVRSTGLSARNGVV